MQIMKIQLHKTNIIHSQPHFFIQSKGYNAGRPSAKSYTNSHVVLCDDEIEKGMLFWICFGLWKLNRFVPLLNASTAYYLNPDDAAKLIDATCGKLSSHPGEFIANVKELKGLIHTEQLLNMQLKIIKRVKKNISRKLLGIR